MKKLFPLIVVCVLFYCGTAFAAVTKKFQLDITFMPGGTPVKKIEGGLYAFPLDVTLIMEKRSIHHQYSAWLRTQKDYDPNKFSSPKISEIQELVKESFRNINLPVKYSVSYRDDASTETLSFFAANGGISISSSEIKLPESSLESLSCHGETIGENKATVYCEYIDSQ